MDRISELARTLSLTLDELEQEAQRRDARELMAPLAWLAEANGWLRYELERSRRPDVREAVPFTYVPVHLRR
jgi:hypothetical protein